jgi:hypothetical protein
MGEEEKLNETGKKVEEKNPMTEDYLATIKELKENTVDRKQYEELVTENRKLLKSIVDGRGEVDQPKQEAVENVKELRAKLFGPDAHEVNNLEYIKSALELRKQLILKGEVDPFLPIGEKITPTHDDELAAQRVADVLQECVEYANGDSAVFTTELQRRTRDVKIR